MTQLGHLMIMASAGSGKTYALTTRFVRLLAGGALPERIVALTFTRKAAGEFFDAILNRLATAATDEKQARSLAREIGSPSMKCDDFLQLLRAMVIAMPRLNLGTLDGFFARMVQAFPLELGLSGEFELLEEAAARTERQKVLGLIFEYGATPTAARDEFIEAFKRATYGVEEKALQRSLDSFLDQHAEVFRSVPEAEAWGNPNRIWPDGGPTQHAPSIAAATTAFQALSRALELTENQQRRLDDFLAELSEWVIGAPMPKHVAYLVKNTLDVAEALRRGHGEVTLERKRLSLESAQARTWLDLIEAIVGAEVERKLEITRGIHAVLSIYETVYHREVRRAGRLTFADVQRLLEPNNTGGLGPDQRLLLDWRLDARFDHWLLDEFQDTSRGQWSILHNLIDEVVQDPEGARSFFYVGDVKQAIYAWRGGDSRLFREIFDYYNQRVPDAIGEQHLAVSWRSSPPVIEMVNAVCGDATVLASIAPEPTVARWMADWREHRSADEDRVGYAEFKEAEGEEGRFEETLNTLRRVDPAGHGLTAAVLVQKNDTGARLAEYLRSEGGLAAVAESDLHIAWDNPLTSSLLALLKTASHPGDTLAREFVAMTPLADVVRRMGWEDRSTLTAQVLREIHEQGFAGTLARWMDRLDSVLAPEDRFSRWRGRQLVEAARVFDETGERSVRAFLDWAETYTLRETVSPGVVRVMTVHKAKGLGFDVVILPDLQGQTIAQRRDGLAVHRNEHHEVDWVMDLPSKVLAESDPVLRQQIEHESAEGAYEALCLLYVALTRAKQAVYVIVEPLKKSKSKNFPQLLNAAFAPGWQAGDPTWFLAERPARAESDSPAEFTFDRAGGPPRQQRFLARTPSGTATKRYSGARWFGVGERGDSAVKGSGMHAELARVEWIDDLEPGAWVEARRRAGGDEDTLRALQYCLEHAALNEVWSRPESAPQVEVWRERAFEIVWDDEWISGAFDRVVLAKDAVGRCLWARLYDFKTGSICSPSDAERVALQYHEQLKLYRRVVSRLTGLREDAVTAEVVFTAVGIRVVIP